MADGAQQGSGPSPTLQGGAGSDVAILLDQLPEGFDPATLMAIADALPVMLAFVDADLRYRFINSPLAEWMAMPRRTLLGRTVEDVMGAEAFATRRPQFDAALAGERQWFAATYDHPSRGPRVTQAAYIPHVGAEGVDGLILIVEDVTEQREADRALRESEARFRRIADSAPVPMWVSDASGRREFINRAYAEFFDVSKDDAAAIEWTERVHPDDAEVMREAIVEGLKSQRPFGFSARARRHDGTYRWMEAQVRPRRDDSGAVVGYVGTANDITLAKQSEHRLRAEVADRDARLDAMFDTIETVIVLMEPDGTIIDANDRHTVWRPDGNADEIGVKIWDTSAMSAYPDAQRDLKKMVARAARGEQLSGEAVLEAPGRERACISTSVQPIEDEDGDVRYILLEARDITTQKNIEAQLRQAQKMEALGQLTGGIAHDFNNLLTVVVGGLDMIARRIEDERLKRYADNALSAAKRGARLTGQLLTFSRVQKLEVRPVAVATILEELRPLVRNVLGPGIDKKFEIGDEGSVILADPTQLEVALLNLAINARDAMPDGGCLTFRTERVTIEDHPELDPGTYVELAIGDTGEGMSAETRARAFEPFFTTKQVGKGTGLGLSMVYGMARQSGGTATVDSEEGVGTTVRLYFRCTEEAAAAGTHDAKSVQYDPKLADHTILLVDDDQDVRDFVAAALDDQGADVRVAGDGREGMERYAEMRPDLVILDFLMPGLSGADVAKHILAECPEQKLLFISGYSETDAIKAVAPDAPMLAKPFTPEDLAAAVATILA